MGFRLKTSDFALPSPFDDVDKNHGQRGWFGRFASALPLDPQNPRPELSTKMTWVGQVERPSSSLP